MPLFGEDRFDLIFADPPYFLSNGGVTCQSGKLVSVNKGTWDNSRGMEANHEYNMTWLRACQEALTPNGTLIVSGTHHTIHSIGFALQKLGYKIINSLTWNKPNPPPNLTCRCFTHSTETILWAAKNHQSKHYFDYKEMKRINGDRQMKTMWTIPPPRKAEKLHGKHPTQKPLALLDRLIVASTPPRALILDPFCGSATTGLVAHKLKRRFVGIEIDPKYLRLSMLRYRDMLTEENSSHIPAIPELSELGATI